MGIMRFPQTSYNNLGTVGGPNFPSGVVNLDANFQMTTVQNLNMYTVNHPESYNEVGCNATDIYGDYPSSYPAMNHNYPINPNGHVMMEENYHPDAVAPCSDMSHLNRSYYDPALASSPPLSSCALGDPPSPTEARCVQDEIKIQEIKSHLIKTSLKEKVLSRHHQNQYTLPQPHTDPCLSSKEEFYWYSSNSNNLLVTSDDSLSGNMLTPEDEERRKRRRERNKIAATKCRNKKKAKTQNLEREAEVEEQNNVDLKKTKLELERMIVQLRSELQHHDCNCSDINNTNNNMQHENYCENGNDIITENYYNYVNYTGGPV